MPDISGSVFDFLSNFPQGFARSNRYMVEMQLPPGIEESGSWLNTESTSGNINGFQNSLNGKGQVQIACHTCSMPSRVLGTYPHSQHCAPFRVPFTQQYMPVSFSFYTGRDYAQRHFFDIWQTAVININDNSLNFFSEYTQDVNIWQLDRNNDKTYGVKLYAAWPVAIGEIQLGYSNNNQIVNVTITLEFKLWKSINDTTNITIY
jgi:hypothetical protein